MNKIGIYSVRKIESGTGATAHSLLVWGVQGELPFVLFEVTPMDRLYGPRTTHYVMVQLPRVGKEVRRPTIEMEESLAAHKWHAKRRRAITAKSDRKPSFQYRVGSHQWIRPRVLRYGAELKKAGISKPGPCYENTAILAACVVSQLYLAMTVVPNLSFLAAAALSWTVGAFNCYAFQALNHELNHELMVVPWRYWLNHALMVLGSVQCSFPWHAYYTFFHARHHAYTGSNNDKDGVILFSSWYRPWRWLQGSILGRWLWTAIFAVGIFGFYLENKLAELREDCKVLPPKYAEQLRRSTFLGLCQLLSIQVVGWLVAHSFVFWYGGFAGCCYMWALPARSKGRSPKRFHRQRGSPGGGPARVGEVS